MTTSPTHSQPLDQTLTSQNPSLPLHEDHHQDPHSQSHPSKTLTLESPILHNPDHTHSSPQDGGDRHNPLDLDQNEEDREGFSATSARAGEPDLPAVPATGSATPVITSVYRRGTKRKKMGQKRRAAQEKKSLQKLEVLNETLKPIPFVPVKNLDFSSHEKVLKRLGLWDFVHIEFDRAIRADLLAQLIANFNHAQRCSYVNGTRVLVNRADLARALKLPVKKTSPSDGAEEVPATTEESIGFLEDFVSNWMLLHDELWMMPNEVLNWTKAIKEGNFEKVDWAGMIWFMIEKELMQAPVLTNCYYASHLQRLIKSQREELLVSERPKIEIEVDLKEDEDDSKEEELISRKQPKVEIEVDLKEDEDGMKEEELLSREQPEVEVEVHLKEKNDDDLEEQREEDHNGDVKMGGEDDVRGQGLEECSQVLEVHGQVLEEHGHELEEHSIELSLGQDNVVEKADAVKEQVADEGIMDFEGCKEDEPAQWLLDGRNSVSEPFLRPCNLGEHKDLDVEDERKLEDDEEGIVQHEEQQEQVEEQEEEEEDEEEEDMEEEQEEQDGGFHFSPKSMGIDGLPSGSLIQSIEAAGIGLSSGMSLRDPLAGDFPSPRDDTRMPLLFGNSSKRENDDSHHPVNANKRLRIDGPWDNSKSPCDFEICMDQISQLMGKARMIYAAKDQASQESTVNQQILLNELQQRENMIQHLHKAKLEEQQTRQIEVYRLERELYLMSNLVDGYRKALKETHRAFAEYRARCPQLDEPLYKDVAGSGGLVLSTMELEKLRLKREEEERINRLVIERKVNDFEVWWGGKFTEHVENVDVLASKLLNVENEVKLLRDSFAKRRVSETSEPAQNDSEPAQCDSEPAQNDSESAQNDSEPAQVDSEPAQNDSESAQNDSEPAQVDSEPAQNDSEPAQIDTEPAQNDTEPAQNDSEPVQNDSEPAQNDS
ncbi:hypothetical protein TorRG33x02_226350 [Trema orientale]|uniref:Uncharacterized protein n=1 Tax=Trema orientale TaxID=63057 RepID=A0A2P5E7S5_TREOI|nr:hypothetical protein TorRG33x02_226350 [Trema orientale]